MFMNAPHAGQYLVAKENVIVPLEEIEGTELQHITVIATPSTGKGFSKEQNLYKIPFSIATGEWYQIQAAIYPSKSSKIANGHVILSLALNKRHKNRRWIQVKLRKMFSILKDEQEIEGEWKFFSPDRNVYCSGEELNGKVMLVDTLEEAVRVSNNILGTSGSGDSQRWQLLDL